MRRFQKKIWNCFGIIIKFNADGWEAVTNPEIAAKTTSREFYDIKSGMKLRFDKGVEAVDHYHIYNPNYTKKKR